MNLKQAKPTCAAFFENWRKDYRSMAAAAHEQQFIFYPDTPVTTAREMSDALFAYANDNRLDLVITTQSMTPHFTLDGVEYRAVRRYANVRGIPVAAVRCEVTHPEDFEPDLPPRRKRLLKLLHYGWPLAFYPVFNLLILLPRGLSFTWWSVLIFAALAAGSVSSVCYNYFYYYNADGKKGR